MVAALHLSQIPDEPIDRTASQYKVGAKNTRRIWFKHKSAISSPILSVEWFTQVRYKG